LGELVRVSELVLGKREVKISRALEVLARFEEPTWGDKRREEVGGDGDVHELVEE
jgi:hypothetical protein